MTGRPIQVIYLVSTLRRTGPTTQLYNIVQHLDGQRFTPTIVTISPEPAASMLRTFTNRQIPVRSLSLSRLQAAMRRRWRVAVADAASPLNGAMVIHSQGLRADVISARHLAEWPRVATVRNYPYEDYVMKYGRAIGTVMAATHVRALRALPAVVACSSSLAAPLKQCGIDTMVIRNGVDTEAFRAATTDTRERLRKEHGLAPDQPVGVCIGTLSTRKDPLNVIRAVKSLAPLNVTVLFIGSGELDGACREAAAGDERIRLIGHVGNVLPYLQFSDFFISAASSEGLPNSVLEALATGLPVVLSDIGPHRELLDLVPAAGELFATGDAAAMAQAIGRTMQRGPLPGRDPSGPLLEEISAVRMSQRYQEIYAALATG
jgi:glycosyltransferase involved in cell wall biosynthesis